MADDSATPPLVWVDEKDAEIERRLTVLETTVDLVELAIRRLAVGDMSPKDVARMLSESVSRARLKSRERKP